MIHRDDNLNMFVLMLLDFTCLSLATFFWCTGESMMDGGGTKWFREGSPTIDCGLFFHSTNSALISDFLTLPLRIVGISHSHHVRALPCEHLNLIIWGRCKVSFKSNRNCDNLHFRLIILARSWILSLIFKSLCWMIIANCWCFNLNSIGLGLKSRRDQIWIWFFFHLWMRTGWRYQEKRVKGFFDSVHAEEFGNIMIFWMYTGYQVGHFPSVSCQPEWKKISHLFGCFQK